eukprot:1866332-Rhodomonas_salina.2
MPCPVPRSRVNYALAMSCPDLGYDIWAMRFCYAMSCTEIVSGTPRESETQRSGGRLTLWYDPTPLLCDVRYTDLQYLGYAPMRAVHNAQY